jgi:hypothetical protein
MNPTPWISFPEAIRLYAANLDTLAEINSVKDHSQGRSLDCGPVPERYGVRQTGLIAPKKLEAHSTVRTDYLDLIPGEDAGRQAHGA